PLGNVALTLTGTRNGVALPPVNASPQAVSAAPSRSVFSSSFNVLLPAAWLSGDVVLSAKIDPGNALVVPYDEKNTAVANLVFHDVPALKIKIVPIVYTHTPNGQTYAFASNIDTISDWIKRIYPVGAIDVTFHAPVPFVGDLANTDGSGWNQLLDT